MGSEEDRPVPPLPLELCASLVEEAPVGVCVVVGDRVVYGNRWLREFGGFAAGEALPHDALRVVHPADRALVNRRLALLFAGEEPESSCTVRFVGRDGGVRDVELHARSCDYHGRPAVQATLIDVTARVDAERNLQADAARLEESSRLRLLFGDILSHDLMNPVWIAENYLRLAMDGGVPDDRRPFYDGMRGALARARGILADARTYLRIQELVAFGGEGVDLGRLVETVVESLRPLGAEKGQRFAASLAENAMVTASPLIREVVWQLLANAVKYGPPDSTIEVAVTAGPRVRLEVRDHGAGVPEEGRERIFQRFERMEKGPITGVGLGLAIVRRVVDLHRGRVWVEGHPEGGSVFVAEFPAAD